jgi:probable phosphoglycerate mutase
MLNRNAGLLYIPFIMMLIVVRHGETEWNVEHREIGQLDSPLTDRGIRQAEAIGRRLRSFKIDHFYSSDLGRAVHTSEIISKYLPELKLQLDAGLRERSMGAFEGLTWDEIRERYPSKEEEYVRNGFFEFVPGGESAQQRVDRTEKTFTAIAERHPEETVLAVTHSGILTGLLQFVLGVPFANGQRFIKQNASFNSFEYGKSGWRLHTWNDVGHLDGMK